jgi:hypothetical protein
MKVAEVVLGVVRNVVEVDPDNRPAFTSGWPEAQNCGPGWTYAAGKFSPPAPPVIVATPELVDAERNRRLNSVFMFAGKAYDCDRDSMARITGAATLAGFAIGKGAGAGNLRWHGAASDFVWIAHDNTMTPMDAPTCFAFGQAAAANQSAHVFAARALKDMTPIPANFADDQYWP